MRKRVNQGTDDCQQNHTVMVDFDYQLDWIKRCLGDSGSKHLGVSLVKL